MKATAQIFLSYAREDGEKVENLYQELSDAGFTPWMDKKDIFPGEIWKSSIQKAIQRSDFFLACLSANSVNKRGFLQKEIKSALDIWQEKLDSDIYLIPVRLEDCEVPESLCDFQWVNLFEEDGWTRLVEAIQVGMGRRAELIRSKQYDTADRPSQISRVGVSSSKSRVEITLRGDLPGFTPEQQSAVVGALAGILNIPREQVRVLEIRGGSTILQIEMPIEAVKRLISLYEAGDPMIQALGIQQVRVIPNMEVATPEEGPERVPMAQQITPPHDSSFTELLSKALLSIVQKLSEPIFLFVIAICVIALLAAAVGGESLVVELRVLLALLAVVAVVAVIVSQLLSSRNAKGFKPLGGTKMLPSSLEMNARKKRVDLLRQCLDRLNENEFQELIVSLLSPSERTRLTQPGTRTNFLGDLEQWGDLYLDSLEDTLYHRDEWRKRLSHLLEQLSEDGGGK